MIKTEQFYIGERLFNRVYSTTGRYVVRDGISYSEACDPAEFGRIYTEGDLMPDDERGDELAAKAEAYDILVGEKG